MASFDDFVFPGENVGSSKTNESLFGTYCNDKNELIATISGIKQQNGNKIHIKHWKKADKIPAVNDIVIAKIIKITQRYAQAHIMCINDKPLFHSCIGIIRQQDVRELDIDTVQMWKCFRPSDIIKAKIISLGNQNDYYLSTSESHFGVISATSTFGHPLKPISWNKMQCTNTNIIESRKVAKLK
eukprot:241298_1